MDEQVVMPEAEVPEPPQIGMLSRFIAVFFDPRKAFSSIRKNHEWIVVVIIVSALAFGSFQLTKPIVIEAQRSAIEERLEGANIPEERKQEILDDVIGRMSNPLMQLLTPVFIVIILLIISGILLFLGNIILGGQTKFLLVMNMLALSWLISIPETIVKVPLMLSKGSAQVHTSLALLVSSEQANTFLGALLGKFDLFGLWTLGLVIFGMSILTRASVTKCAWTVGIVWFIWALIEAGLASLGINLGGM
jgi:hypothetical protein